MPDMRTELTELEEQEVAEALKSFLDRPTVNSSSDHCQFGAWLEELFNNRLHWGVDPAVLRNYAECFCFANGIHPAFPQCPT